MLMTEIPPSLGFQRVLPVPRARVLPPLLTAGGGGGCRPSGRNRHRQDRNRQDRQTRPTDSPTYRNQLPVPACGALLPEGQRRGQQGPAQEVQRERGKGSHLQAHPNLSNGQKVQPIPSHPASQSSIHLSIHPFIYSSIHASVHRPSLTEGWVGAAPSKGAAGDARWDASCSVFSCSRRTV